MAVTLQKEMFRALMPELPPLLYDEWFEATGGDESRQKLSPAWDKFIQMEMLGILHVVTARADGKLVGYIFNVVHPHLHFSNTLYSFIDAFYIDPAHRQDGTPEALEEENIQMLASAGIARVQMVVSATLWLYKLMKKLQYERTESNFMKWLE